MNWESVSELSLLSLAWKKKVCEPEIMLSVEYLNLILASVSEKGQMLSASLISCIQKSCPLCLPVHSQISHSLALSLWDFFFFFFSLFNLCFPSASFFLSWHSFLGA